MLTLLEAKVFPHKHNEGKFTQYHIFDDKTGATWCSTDKRHFLDHIPLTMNDWRHVRTTQLPKRNVCQTCIRNRNEYLAAVRLIEARRKRFTSPDQLKLFA